MRRFIYNNRTITNRPMYICTSRHRYLDIDIHKYSLLQPKYESFDKIKFIDFNLYKLDAQYKKINQFKD